jgi:hypothetical protein
MPLDQFRTMVDRWFNNKNLPRQADVIPDEQVDVRFFTVDQLSEINNREVSYICGKYHVYRYSLSGVHAIVKEIMVIEPISGDNQRCRVTILVHPVDATEGSDKELFRGIIFKFGNAYNIMVSYSNGHTDKRIRYIQFPLLTAMTRRVHYGVILGDSANLQEPAVARIIVYKTSQPAIISEEDHRLVQRLSPDDVAVSKVVGYLNSSPRSADSPWLLTVDKSRTVTANLQEDTMPPTAKEP